MRVRLELGLISEVELVTYRTGAGPAWNDAGHGNLEKMKTPKPLWNETAGKRLSRQELAQAALSNGNFASKVQHAIKLDHVDSHGVGLF